MGEGLKSAIVENREKKGRQKTWDKVRENYPANLLKAPKIK